MVTLLLAVCPTCRTMDIFNWYLRSCRRSRVPNILTLHASNRLDFISLTIFQASEQFHSNSDITWIFHINRDIWSIRCFHIQSTNIPHINCRYFTSNGNLLNNKCVAQMGSIFIKYLIFQLNPVYQKLEQQSDGQQEIDIH